MGAIRFDADELRSALARTVRWRWPSERLLVTVPCEAEWPIVRDPWSPDLWRDDPDLTALEELGREPGGLGVTERRLLYRTDERHDLMYRLASWTLAGVAGIVFLAGEVRMAALTACLALLIGALGRVVEVFGLGSVAIELAGVLKVDHADRRVQGVDRWGVQYRLVLAETDFAVVASLIGW